VLTPAQGSNGGRRKAADLAVKISAKRMPDAHRDLERELR
jgi:hypothetical protein